MHGGIHSVGFEELHCPVDGVNLGDDGRSHQPCFPEQFLVVQVGVLRLLIENKN